MAITREYESKLNMFLETLPRRVTKHIGVLKFEGFLTYDKLSYEEAIAHERKPLDAGFRCGKKWEYLWIFATVTIPAECEGKSVGFRANYREGIVFVNGKIHGAMDWSHRMIPLTECAKTGETFQVAMEVYAGHDGDRPKIFQQKHSAILLPGDNREDFGDNINQLVVSDGDFATFDNEIFALEMDITFVYDLYKSIPDRDSLRVAMLSKALKKVCDTVDIEAEDEEFYPMVAKAREILKPLLEAKNGSTVPTAYVISHSHLDLEWLWTRNETRRKTARTMGNQLKIMEHFPDSKYFQSQAWIFNSLKTEYPDFYEDVKKAVAQGKVVPEGGMWVESDVNIPCGESLIRQFLFGKRFYAEEFGINSELFWLPDSFGMTAALPQIMKKCGIKYFITCKLLWLFNDSEKFPHTNFMWKGHDGSEILSHLCGGYQFEMHPHSIYTQWNTLNHEKEEVPFILMPFGYGDGGGGAVRRHFEMAERGKNTEGMPNVVVSTPIEFMKKLESECEIKTTYVGEPYYPNHRGTYTSQAKTKNLNRRNEFALREAEMWSTLFGADTKAQTDELWKIVLFDQFHDILPGSAITRTYEVAEAELTESLEKADAIALSALDNAVSSDNTSLTVANSLSWNRDDIITLPEGYTSLADKNGNAVETQLVDGKVYALVNAPSCGLKSYTLGKDDVKCVPLQTSELILENDLIKAQFNNKGELVSVIDKETDMEFLSDASNKFRMYQDLPIHADAWDIDSFYENLEVELCNDSVVTGTVKGDLISYLTIEKKIHNSKMTQKVFLEKGSKQIKFETEIDWNESHKLLKVDFNTNIHTENLISEIQHGYCSRPNHKSRPYDADRFEVCQHKWSALTEHNRGAAILNNNKYGISSDAGKMSLTLLKSAEDPARHADRGIQTFTYSFMPFTQNLFDSNVVTEAFELNRPVIVKTGYAEEKSMMSVDKKNIIIDTVKTAEDASGDIIVRLYESKNSFTPCKLDLGFDVKKAYVTNMLEENEKEIDVNNNSISLNFGVFEVITLRLAK